MQWATLVSAKLSSISHKVDMVAQLNRGFGYATAL